MFVDVVAGNKAGESNHQDRECPPRTTAVSGYRPQWLRICGARHGAISGTTSGAINATVFGEDSETLTGATGEEEQDGRCGSSS